MRRGRRGRSRAGALAMLLAAVPGVAAAGEHAPCPECIEIRVDRPRVVRGPSRHEPDAPLSIIRLPDGSFRGFAANGITLAIDGASPFAMGGEAKVVLRPGPAGSAADCGRWLTTAIAGRSALYGLIHNEYNCKYNEGQTHKSMSIAFSDDYGLSWNVLGQVITGDDGFVPKRPSGEGDCTAVDGHDGYLYAYCQRLRDWKNTVVRAPIADPSPGTWRKWSGAGWEAPGLGGTGVPLETFLGMSSAYWREADAVLLMGATGSLRLAVSSDKVHFRRVPEPILLYDADAWKRPAPTDLYAYPSMVAEEGGNEIGRHFFLTYTYIPPGEDFTQRYLVMHDAWIASRPAPSRPQVRVALTRWRNRDGGKWATTGPPIFSGHPYAYEMHLGYLMTAPPPSASLELDECFSKQSATGFLAEAGGCAAAGGERRRVAGYVYRAEELGTIALQGCIASDGARFVSNRRDCENAGMPDRLLGFALK